MDIEGYEYKVLKNIPKQISLNNVELHPSNYDVKEFRQRIVDQGFLVEYFIGDIPSDKAYGVYNIGSGRSTTINDLAQLILKLTNRTDLKPTYAPPRHGDIRQSVADITKARKELSFKPNISLNNGIKMLLTIIRTDIEIGNKRGRC